LLRGIAARLEAGSADLVERAGLETALPAARLQSELARTCHQLRLFAGMVEQGWWVDARIDHGDPGRKPAPKPDVRSMLRPLGPVAVFGASNFPLAFSVAGGDTASALAAGCPVVVKAHPAHPGTSELAGLAVQEAIRGAGLPQGVFSLLFDAGHDVGIALVRHAAIRAVGFTGSRRGGRAIAEAAAGRAEPIPVYAEMGSVNPVFLLPGALRQRPAEIAGGLQASVTLGVGQFCTNPGLVFLEEGDGASQFLRSLEERQVASAPGTMLTAGIGEAYRLGIWRLSDTPGVEPRVIIAAEPGAGGAGAGAALFVTGADTFLAEAGLKDELFGPSTLVVRCSTRQRLLDVAQALEGQLTVSVHGTEADLAESGDLFEILESKAGRLVYNGFPTGVEVCPAMVHGGPWPATSDGRSTSVGTRAVERFTRPVCFQGFPDPALPEELQETNPLGIRRLVDGRWSPS
jgi:NADP-dependent aldehyde dehydrogenase